MMYSNKVIFFQLITVFFCQTSTVGKNVKVPSVFLIRGTPY